MTNINVSTLDTYKDIGMGLNKDIKQKKFKSEFEKVVVNLMFSRNWLDEQQQKVLKPFGLTVPQYNVMRILRGQHPEVCTVNLIIERMLDRMSNVSRIVDKLVSKELVSRIPNLQDRRAVDVFITDQGLNILEQLDDSFQELFEKINSFSDEECSLVNDFLDRFRGTEPD
ncbi:MarR family winged helix-turn-helix transcriptional regulator [Reichenbachiella sp.]|uniref:MarR family winged helix-turn-helix transcriptional regulator n=1 Tax=Reichenbachiella sp. TaxID=2184521 RepID=UPI003BAFE596